MSALCAHFTVARTPDRCRILKLNVALALQTNPVFDSGKKTMQPCYGINDARLTEFYSTLRRIGAGAIENDPFTKALLWLAGLKYAFSYFKAANSGSKFETYLAPAHRLDDGLHETACMVLKRLMRGARSRTMTNTIKEMKEAVAAGLMNEEWSRIQLTWVLSRAIEDGRVHGWLARTNAQEGWLRLCVATGILSLWSLESCEFIQSMIRKPFPPLALNLDDDKNRQIFDCVKAFVRDHRVDMKEL
jgi:hypothetical protein